MSTITPGYCPMPGAHYLSPQTSSRVPRRYLFFDTEAWRTETPAGEVQTWRLGVSATVTWRERTQTWTEPKFTRHATPESLWEVICAFAKKDARTVVVAHNLAYDLRIAMGLTIMPEWGWAVERPTFSGEHVSLEATKDGKRLLFVDSLSVIPHGLATIGAWLGTPKPELPDNDGAEADWWERCEADVAILAKAYITIVDWLARDDIGGWARTGPGIGWHVMLRSHLADKVLVHNRPEVRDAEAAAMYSGRAEVWKHGNLKGGPWYEWDYALAYANVCAQNPLPTVLVDEVRGCKLERIQRSWPAYTWLVEAEATTDVPVLPWTDEVGICWPVGTFSGWWWDHELVNAVEAGAKVKVRRAYRYKAAPWLSSWALWCMDQVNDVSSPEAKIRGAAAKHWQRAIPGRTAMKFKPWEHKGDAWVPGVGYMPLLDHDTGARGAALTLGDQRWEAWTEQWWDQALPQVLSSVMAYSRTRLWHAMVTAGFENIACCHTDNLWVNKAGHDRLTEAVADGYLWSLRLKNTEPWLKPTAPQLVEGSSYRIMAGVPRNTWVDEEGKRWGEVWEGATEAFNQGHPSEVHIRKIPIKLKTVDTRRLHLPGGLTAPFTVAGGIRQARAEEAS